ncbi:hypothetical protein B6D16_08145, partial [Gilliamella apicola]|uniref:tail fiber protein n=1 Tax=Gilliamella apicola TaxID=1196095 RepID=UPI000B6E2562
CTQVYYTYSNSRIFIRNYFSRTKTWTKWAEKITTANINNYLPIGIPQPWPCNQPPEGWLECNGSPFDKNQFPKLGAIYDRWLPDLRGEFIRGWDHWKDADPNREILSWQDCMIQSHNHSTLIATYNEQGDGNPWGSGSNRYEEDYIFDTAYTGGHETRPRNVAFMYIVKAE